MAALPDGRIASCGFDGALRVWSLATWRQEAIVMLDSTAFSLAALPLNLLLCGLGNHSAWVLDVSPGSSVRRLCVLRGHTDAVFAVSHAGAALAATGSRDRSVRVFDLVHLRAGSTSGAIGADASSSGEAVPCVSMLRGHKDSVTALAPLPDGMLASASSDSTVRVWDIAAGVSLLVLAGHARAVLALAPLPARCLLASAGEDGTVRVWALEHAAASAISGAGVGSSGPSLGGSCVGILLSSGDSGAAGSGTVSLNAPASATPSSARSIWALAATPSGLIAAAGDDGVIRLWDPVCGACIASYRGEAGGAIHGLDVPPAPVVAAMGAAPLAGHAALITANFDDCSVSVIKMPIDVLTAPARDSAACAPALSRAAVAGAGIAGLLVRSTGAPEPPREVSNAAAAAAAVATAATAAHVQSAAELDVVIELS